MGCKDSDVYPWSGCTLSLKNQKTQLALEYRDSFQAVISCIKAEENGMTESLTLEIAIRVPSIYKLSIKLYLKIN